MSKKPCPVNHAGFIVPTVLLPTPIVIGQGAEAQTIVVYVTSEAMCTFPECGQVFYFSKPRAIQEAQKRGESSVPSTIIPPPASMPVPDPNCAICHGSGKRPLKASAPNLVEGVETAEMTCSCVLTSFDVKAPGTDEMAEKIKKVAQGAYVSFEMALKALELNDLDADKAIQWLKEKSKNPSANREHAENGTSGEQLNG